MLRASSDATGSDYKADAIAKGTDAGDGNIPSGSLLVEFAEAAFQRDEVLMVPLRSRVIDQLGEQGLVDACGVIGNFQRMVRVADGTGIPLDEIMLSLSSDLRASLDLDRFTGAQNVRSSVPRRVFHRLLRPLLRRVLPRVTRNFSN